jgi:hypothetical protein
MAATTSAACFWDFLVRASVSAAEAAPALTRFGAEPCPPAPLVEPALICPIVMARSGGEELRKRKVASTKATALTGQE